MPIRQDLTQLEPSELAKALSQLSARPFHARQIYQWFYKRDVTQFAEMTDLSYTLRERLDQTFIVLCHTWIKGKYLQTAPLNS